MNEKLRKVGLIHDFRALGCPERGADSLERKIRDGLGFLRRESILALMLLVLRQHIDWQYLRRPIRQSWYTSGRKGSQLTSIGKMGRMSPDTRSILLPITGAQKVSGSLPTGVKPDAPRFSVRRLKKGDRKGGLNV